MNQTLQLTKALLFACASLCLSLPGTARAAGASSISFASEIRPILNKNCVGCHGGVKRAGDISFIVPDTVVAQSPTDTKKPIQPGRPDQSELIRRVTSTDPEVRMPPPEHGRELPPDQIAKLRAWIAAGAHWEPHWSFLPPRKIPPAQTQRSGWAVNELDAYVLARMEKSGLQPNPPASKRSWLRRVSFDVTGLPPTPAEIQAFEADTSPDAYAKVADRLLASPAYGERWASVWLDLARYSDSMGFEKDPNRTIWPWRDWVIRAFNENLPFDQFTIRQLAGDLLPNATLEDRLATAFHRNTQNNTEGGTDDEEFRTSAVLDRVNTTFEAWQGLTFKCTQCHAHPYEPIDHHEYFQALAFFNGTRDWDLREEYPTLNVPNDLPSFQKAHALDREKSQLLKDEFTSASSLRLQTSSWVRLQPTKVSASHGTKLVTTLDGEIRTEGTVAHYSAFEVSAQVPSPQARITAIRLQVLPVNPTKARLDAEMGFMVSRFRMALVPDPAETPLPPGTAAEPKPKDPPLPGEIHFSHAFGDEAEPFTETERILDADKPGWGAYTRMTGPREIVLVLKEPLTVTNNRTLQFEIRHDEGPGDFAALVMNRFVLSFSEAPGWRTFVESQEFLKNRERIAKIKRERQAITGVNVPVIDSLEPQFARTTAVFVRGNWLEKDQEVQPGVPRIFQQTNPAYRFGEQAPGIPGRLAFAQWLVSTNNPLTARVAVNRVWEQLFGLGIVETLEDFGSSGEPPSNPELLDYLAIRFQSELAWDLKQLLRELVLSATYRQDATASPEKMQKDPRNRFLARGPRVRLSAEMVRDQALLSSGLLASKMYGPPVMPPQPDGIWRAAYSGEKWLTATNENRFRRAVYTYIRRTAGYPSFQTFDAPSRDVCTARRLRTNTPLQALVTMNDPVYVESAANLARLMRDHSSSLPERIRFGWERVTSMVPAEADVQDLCDLYERGLAAYQNAETHGLAETPELSALALVSSTLLNLDASLNR